MPGTKWPLAETTWPLRVDMHDQLLAEDRDAVVDLIEPDMRVVQLRVGLDPQQAQLVGRALQAEQRAILIEEPARDRLGVALLGRAGRVGQAPGRIFGRHELDRLAARIPAQIQRAGGSRAARALRAFRRAAPPAGTAIRPRTSSGTTSA